MSKQFMNLLPRPRLQDKVAIITGAASGIGEAAVRLFASHGATVVIADIQDEQGNNIATSIQNSTYIHCDVTNEQQVQHTINHTVRTYGRLDIMFSNAGIIGSSARPIMDLDMEQLDRIMAVNVRGTASAIKHSAKAMVELGLRGSIICTASVASCQGGFGPADYTASKHAVLGLVRSAAGELGRHGIRVNAVSPFGVATGLSCGMGWKAEEVEHFTSLNNNLKGGALKAEHVAESALFFASEESARISGHNLLVDGGTTVCTSLKLE